MAENNKTDEPTKEDILVEERRRVATINETLPGDHLAAVRAAAIAEGLSIEQAQAAAYSVAEIYHVEKLAAVQGELDLANSRLKAIAEGGSTIPAGDPVDADEDGGGAGFIDNGTAGQFAAVVADYLKAGTLTKSRAIQQAVAYYPKSHKAWLAEKNGKKNI